MVEGLLRLLSAVMSRQPKHARYDKGSSGFNLGGTYDLNENYHLLFSAGRGIQNAMDTNQFSYYLGLQLTY
jgi:hypothetical protein